MRRLICTVSVLVGFALLWTGCQTFSDMTVNEEERNLRRLKRGTLSEAGLYSNLFYQFEIRIPEGWSAVIGDPPELLKVTPSSKDLSQSSARKFVNVIARVQDRLADETIEQFVERYAAARGYEKVLERPATVFGFPSIKIMFYGQEETKEIKITSLIVLREKMVNIVECRALRPLFDNFESKFGACLDSFKASGTDVPVAPPPREYSAIDPATDVITYIVTPTDTVEDLAVKFLGSKDRAGLIVSTNAIEKLNAGDRIKIPRSIPYDVNPGDTWPLISQKILEDTSYSDTIFDYNGRIDLSSATTIQIPFYTSEPPVVGDTYISIAMRKYNDQSLAQNLMEYNNMEPLESLEKIKLPIFLIQRYYVYKVQPNDSLAWIARWLTGDPNNYQQIGAFNNIEYPYRLIIGQELKIPGSMVSDPSVFEKPLPRSKPSPKPADSETPSRQPAATKPTPEPANTATPTPRPINDSGLFDIE